ncbi:MAG: cobaltochelatase subunit CobN [Telmatospirillum sp.]|nr:cobaltochelatase subunit CobN [Telmatospirillum sp.]
MTAVTVVLTHPSLDRIWEEARRRLSAEGILLVVAHQMQSRDWEAFVARDMAAADAVYLDITRHFASFDLLLTAIPAGALVIPAGLEAKAALPDADGTLAGTVQAYLKEGTAEALVNAVHWMLYRAGRRPDVPVPPGKPVLAAIHHPAAEELWRDGAEFLAWADKRAGDGARPAVAVIGDRNAWLNGDLEAIHACVTALEAIGAVAVPMFCDWELAAGLDGHAHPLTRLIGSLGDRLGAIWNSSVVHGRTGQGGGAEEAGRPEDGPFACHGVPVLQLIRHWSATEAEWRASAEGLSAMTVSFGITRPEMLGAIDPTVFAASTPPVTGADGGMGGARRPVPIGDQIRRLAGRTAAWMRLRRLENGHKRIAILLHNPPCKALEATVGNASSLDALESTVRLLWRLKTLGYDVGEPPEDGRALLAQILERKALSEFRWTNVEEIVAKGGVLAEIDEAAYRADFDRLPAEIRDRVDAAWGRFPARSMVRDIDGPHPRLVITGLRFGAVTVMTEPKRGCWGARCDGEVCRILHEPDIAPPHHWLATFFYLQHSVDALVVMGAEGPLEYLPGKRVGLSERCFGTLSLGDLPVIYPYAIHNVGEALIARRRGRAVLVGHLGAPVARVGDRGTRWDGLEDLHRQYCHAAEEGGARRAALAAGLQREMASLGLIDDEADEETLTLAIGQLPRRLALLRGRSIVAGVHVLGRAPDAAAVALYRDEALSALQGDEAVFERALARSTDEMEAVVGALAGRFVAPGPGGQISRRGGALLPTGRNIHGIDLSLLPTRAAAEVGARMGEELLRAYLADEGDFPETIGITLWSSDAFQSDGELAAQILWLMGCTPRHDRTGKVTGVTVEPLDTLTLTLPDGTRWQRPRIDVVVQMSAVVRDVLPGFYALFDQAVAAVRDRDEPADRNFVRAHIAARMAELAGSMADAGDAALKRLASYRCFSSADGAYGTGIGLALDASAWEDDADLAEVLVNWTGHAYGAGGPPSGLPPSAVLSTYAGLVRRMDLSYQRASSAAGDLLAYGCTVGTLGGAAAAKRGLGGGRMRLYWGDAASGSSPGVRSVREELALSLAASLLNRDWLDRAKDRGYGGGAEVGERANHLFAWSATTHEVQKAQFDAVHDMYVRDEANRDWLSSTNPYAFEELTRRLLEANARSLWAADPARLAELHAAVLAIEGDMEDGMGPVRGEFQGASVDIMTRQQVKEWHYEFRAK